MIYLFALLWSIFGFGFAVYVYRFERKRRREIIANIRARGRRIDL